MQYSILDSYKKDILENKTMTTKCKRILETSIDLFAKNGYSNTSTSEKLQGLLKVQFSNTLAQKKIYYFLLLCHLYLNTLFLRCY